MKDKLDSVLTVIKILAGIGAIFVGFITVVFPDPGTASTEQIP